MISLAVFETRPAGIGRMKEALAAYAIRRDIELQAYWFTSPQSHEQMATVIGSTSMALISAAGEDSEAVGRQVYLANPDCRIVYYGPEEQPLRPLLRSRPIDYHVCGEGSDALFQTLDEILREIADSSAVFRFRSRSKTLFLPTREILYFQSSLKNVQICLRGGKTETITAKLSDIERQQGGAFIRIHQSYLVNPAHIRLLDRRQRTVSVSNGELLPISDAKYDFASTAIDRLCEI